jgi:hypothetical protein
MVHFQTKNPYLGKFWRALQWQMLVYFVAIWSILLPFGNVCRHLVYFWPFGIFLVIWYIFGHLVYFVAIWYILWSFGLFFMFCYDNLATCWTSSNKKVIRSTSSASQKLQSESIS